MIRIIGAVIAPALLSCVRDDPVPLVAGRAPMFGAICGVEVAA